MKILGWAMIAGFCVLAGGAASGQRLLVLSKRDHTLAIVNSVSLQVEGKVSVGEDPHEVTASADGRTAYVSNYGFGAYNTLAVVDLVAKKALPAIELGALHGPHGLDFVAGKVWFTAEAAKALGRYDPATGKIDLILGTGQDRTHMIYVSKPEGADGDQTIVTTNVSSATVSIIDREELRMPWSPRPGAPPNAAPGGPPPGGPPMARKDWHETVVGVGHGSEGFDVSPDGREVWVANAQDGTVSVIDLPGKRLITTLEAKVPGANRLKITPDGAMALISAGAELVVLDTRTRKELKRLTIGHGSGGVLIEPNARRAFVACGPDGYVAVIDLKTLAVTGHVAAGDDPDGLAWAAGSGS